MLLSCRYSVARNGTPSLLRYAHCPEKSFVPDAPTHILQCSHDVYRDIFANHSLDFAVECCKHLICTGDVTYVLVMCIGIMVACKCTSGVHQVVLWGGVSGVVGEE